MHEKGPFAKSAATKSDTEELNPLNLMPKLSQAPAPTQSIYLPTERTVSSIPKGDDPNSDEKWEYPSPQQMYNAMLRKGGPAPEDAVEEMVAVHNFLNEGAWQEIDEWEKTWSGGLWEGLKKCFKDEYTGFSGLSEEEMYRQDVSSSGARLLRFEGRSKDRTPKSRILEALGTVWPEKFGTEPPFDRHDWYVRRRNGEQVRYVIDYYSGGMEAGMPVFYLDVRPAVDGIAPAVERLGMWGGGVWRKASGAEARLEKKREKDA